MYFDFALFIIINLIYLCTWNEEILSKIILD